MGSNNIEMYIGFMGCLCFLFGDGRILYCIYFALHNKEDAGGIAPLMIGFEL